METKIIEYRYDTCHKDKMCFLMKVEGKVRTLCLKCVKPIIDKVLNKGN